jgi:hypothetical protein
VLKLEFYLPILLKKYSVFNKHSADSKGFKKCDTSRWEVEKGINNFSIHNLQSLGKGVYMLRIANDEMNTSIKVVNQGLLPSAEKPASETEQVFYLK